MIDQATAERIAAELKAVADPTRLDLLQRAGEGETTLSQVCSEVGISQPAVSHHLLILRAGNLVESHTTRRAHSVPLTLTERGRRLRDLISPLLS
jgi:ArsR family transcriptional regulator